MLKYALGFLVTILHLLFLNGNSAIAVNLIGETLTFRRAYPNIDTDFRPAVMTTVTADNSDLVKLQQITFEQQYHWWINPDADSIFIDVNRGSIMLGSNTIFDGIVISGFSTPIINASFTTNDPSFVYDLTFDSSRIYLNLTGAFDGSEYIDIQVQTQAVPEPTTIIGTFIAFGLGGFLKKKSHLLISKRKEV